MTTQRRAARTFGEITKLPSKRFRARYWGPDGKRYNAPRTYVARTDAEGWLADVERSISRGDWVAPITELPAQRPADSAITVRVYAPEVLERRNLRPATEALYDKLLRLAILPTFGDSALTRITTEEVTTWYRSMKKTPTQQANAYGLLKSLLKQAVEDHLITENPCKVRAGSQKQPAKHIRVLTVAQLTRYLDAVPQRYRVALMLAGWCGLRSGEVRALRLRDIDVEHGIIHVRQGAVRLKGRIIIGQPKTMAGIRDVAIPPHLLDELKLWKEKQDERAHNALAFPAQDGVSPMNDTTLRRAHDRGKAAIEVPDLTIHALRHTSATIAAQMGATIAELQARIGHSTPGMAMRYQHVAAHRDADLAARMSAFATDGAKPEQATPRPRSRAARRGPRRALRRTSRSTNTD